MVQVGQSISNFFAKRIEAGQPPLVGNNMYGGEEGGSKPPAAVNGMVRTLSPARNQVAPLPDKGLRSLIRR